MKTKRLSKSVKTMILALILLVVISSFVLTLAYFQDKKEYSGTLDFGNIKLKVSGGVEGDGVTTSTSKLIFDTARKKNNDSTWTGKYMPGDIVDLNLTVGLENNSEPAYYLIWLYDSKGVFEDAFYYSQNGTDIYVNNETTIKNLKTSETGTIKVGKLSAGDANAHSLTISAKIDENFSGQGSTTVSCKIFAIQQANLSEEDAYSALYPKVNCSFYFPSVVTNRKSLTSLGFYFKSDTTNLTGYTKDSALTTDLDVNLADNDKGKLEIWKKSDTDIAFVSEKTIMAFDCYNLFQDCKNMKKIEFKNFNTSNVENMTGMFDGCIELKTLDLSGFNTSSVKEMYLMFNNCSSLTSLDLSSFNTSNVTEMGSMFSSCSSLTSLDVSSFNTSNVTGMGGMFNSCSSLTSIDLSNFDTSNVTDMNSMFGWCSFLTSLDVSSFSTSNVSSMGYMFRACPSLTSLNLSNFNTSNVTDMSSMFGECSSLQNINISSFDTSKVTDVQYMFMGCSALTSLSISNFNTSNVTMMSYMFSGCSSLTSLDLSNFNTTGVEDSFNMLDMFSNTFSNNPTGSTLIISNNFLIDGNVATKQTLSESTNFDTTVNLVIK